MPPVVGKRPNFFIVGAPKCGTTSLYEYLRQHPEVFMAHDGQHYWRSKEPYYFCEELIAREGMGVHTEEEYLKLFEGATGQPRIGESSALYLYSEQAPTRIKAFAPDARILIMLRHPVEMMMSWHRDCLRWGHEDIVDFREAIEVADQRRAGMRLPPASGYPGCLQYLEMATFSMQVERYVHVFGAEQVKVCLLDDFARDPAATFREVALFLGIDPSFTPSFDVHNEQVALTQAHYLRHRMMNWARAHARWARSIHRALPFRVDRWIEAALTPIARRTLKVSVESSYLALLQRQLTPEIERLGSVIGRDLGPWMSLF